MYTRTPSISHHADKWQPPTAILDITKHLDPTRLVDYNSGGKGNALGIGDVNDIHSYPNPNTERASATPSRYGMVGEYGGIGWAPTGHEFVPGQCQHRSAGNVGTDSAKGTEIFLHELSLLAKGKAASNISAAVYTQITDIECECDGVFAYDRTPHYTPSDIEKIRAANAALIGAEV